MLYDVHIESFQSRIDRTLQYLRSRKADDGTFTVVDVGGSAGGWSHEVADVIVDIKPVGASKFFVCNLNRFQDWEPIHEHVKKHGKFSFAICSHTLEDIANPMLVLEKLPLIAEEGIIAFPSKYREFSRFEGDGRHLGYFHHRWIYDMKDGTLIAYPKLGFLEYTTMLHSIGNIDNDVAELNFRWKADIPYKVVNDDYMGPGEAAVVEYYKNLL
jgi:hypothetical protein